MKRRLLMIAAVFVMSGTAFGSVELHCHVDNWNGDLKIIGINAESPVSTTVHDGVFSPHEKVRLSDNLLVFWNAPASGPKSFYAEVSIEQAKRYYVSDGRYQVWPPILEVHFSDDTIDSTRTMEVQICPGGGKGTADLSLGNTDDGTAGQCELAGLDGVLSLPGVSFDCSGH